MYSQQNTTTTTIIIIVVVVIIIVVVVTTTTTTTIIIITAFKGAVRDLLQSPHCAANCLQHVRSSGPGAIACKSLATQRVLITRKISCYVPLGTKGQLSY